MKQTPTLLLRRLVLCCAWLSLLALAASCGSSARATRQPDIATATVTEKALTEDEQRKFEYFLIEASRLKQSGDYDAALEMYEHCLSIDPTSGAVLYEMAYFYTMLNQADKAQDCFERAVAVNPDNFWYKQTLAAFYQRAGQPDKAIAVYESMAAQFPQRSEPLLALVSLYGEKQDNPNVIRTLDRLEVKEGKSEQFSMEKFRIYLQMDSTAHAFNEIEKLVKEYPNDTRYKLILGGVYLDNDRMDDAYATFRGVLDEEPDNPQAQLAVASYYQRQGNDSLYNACLDRALLNEKLDTPTRLDIMRQLIIDSEQTGNGDTTRIMDMFRRILPLERESADLSMLCTQYMITKQMPDDRIKPVLYHILEIEPDNTVARLQLLSYAVKKDNYNDAIAICRPALEYNPEVIEFYYYLGLSYYQVDRTDEALATFSKGVEQATEKSDKELISNFYQLMGDIYHEKQNNQLAYAAYDSSLVYNPENIGTLNNYAYYLSLERKDLDRAEEMSYKTVKAEPQNATYLDTYAWILFEKGRYAEAKLYIDDAIKNEQSPGAAVWEHCGDIYYMTGDTEKALEFWRKALGMEDNESKTLERKIKLKKYIAE